MVDLDVEVPRPGAPPSLQKTFRPSTSIVLDSIRVAPVSFTDCVFLSLGATVIVVDRADNLAFVKTSLSQSENDRLSSAIPFGLDRSGFQPQSERRVRRDVDEGV